MTDTSLRIALVGQPNVGKTTLFNALTGLRQRVANHPGVTVDATEARCRLPDGGEATLVDLPGLYDMEPRSPDEALTLAVLDGTDRQTRRPDAVLLVLSAHDLDRGLGLALAVAQRGLPTALWVNFLTEFAVQGGILDRVTLARETGLPVLGWNEPWHAGDLDAARAALAQARTWPARSGAAPTPDAETRAFEAGRLAERAVTRTPGPHRAGDRLDAWVLHPWGGTALFLAVMVLFFQVIFTVAAPLQDGLEGAVLALGGLLESWLPEGWIRSLVVDGVVTGVGGVVVFLPQIALLLLMLALLETSGYLARAAFLIDRAMASVGLEGRAFVALLSSYACAIPGMMATRTLADPRARLATLMATPLVTCSARLPVYTVLVAAFIPAERVGPGLQLQGLVMFGLYLLGALSALAAAAVVRRMAPGPAWPFLLELPRWRRPAWGMVGRQVGQGVSSFLRRAGTVILAASVVLWLLLSVPVPGAAWGDMEQSLAAWAGHALQPFFAPLGFDWRIVVALLASLAAREVVVSSLAQLLAVQDSDDLPGLASRLASVDDGGYPLATGLALLLFFVFALQCFSTLAVLRREAGHWGWAAGAFVAYGLLAWGMAWLGYMAVSGWGA
jgi:ferrous iron transport protein B